MTRRLIVEPDAEQDISDGFGWYESRRIDLGPEFLDELEKSLERVADNPLSYTEVVEGIRRAVIHTFPYLLFYRIAEEEIRVLAVLPAAQDPEYIRSRLN